MTARYAKPRWLVFFVKGAEGLCMVYDVTSAESFSNLERWVEEASEASPNGLGGVVVVVCANKVDKSGRTIPEGKGRLWAQSKGARTLHPLPASSIPAPHSLLIAILST